MEQYFFKKIIKQKIDQSSAKYLDWFMRKITSEIQTNGRHLTEKQFDSYKIKLIFYIQEISQFIFQDQHEEDLEKIQQELKQKNYIEMALKGIEYVGKKSVFTERESLYECIKTLIYMIYMKGKKNNKTTSSTWNISHLVFLLCLKENLYLFEITSLQNSKQISKKEQQILFSLRRDLKKKIKLQKFMNSDESIFETTLLQIIGFDSSIDKAKFLLFEATEQKIDILMLMKQKYIDLLLLQGKLKVLYKLRKNIVDQVTKLVLQNSFNHELYDLYFAYLETIAFRERDLSLRKYRNYQNDSTINIQKFIQQSNDENSCVIFASLKNEQNQIIENVSHNFINIFCISPADVIKKPITNLMTPPYAKIHSQYLKNFFQSNRNKSNLKNNLLFAQINNDYILPVSIDFKINFKMNDQLESEFGISAYIKMIQKDKLYIMYDTTTSRVISMTPQTHMELFSAVQDFHKINLISFFPLLSKTINQSTNLKKNQKKKQNNSMMSLKTSMMSLNMTQTIIENNDQQNPTQTQNILNNMFSQRAQKQLALVKQGFQMSQKNNEQENIFGQVLDEQIRQLQQQNTNEKLVHEMKNSDNDNYYFQESAKLDLDNQEQQIRQQSADIQYQQRDQELILSAKYIPKNDMDKNMYATIKDKKSQYSQKPEKQSTVLSQQTVKYEEIVDIPYLFLTLNENQFQQNQKNNRQKMKQSKKHFNDKQSEKTKSNLEKYSFMTMSITVQTVQSQGLNHLKYVEIQNSKRINPFANAQFILNVYKNPALSGFQSNITHIKKATLRILIGELEQIVKDQQQNSHRLIGANTLGLNEDNKYKYSEDDEEYEEHEYDFELIQENQEYNNEKTDQILSKQEKNKLENIFPSIEKKNNPEYSIDNASFIKQNLPQQYDIYNQSLPIDFSRDNSKINLVNNKQAVALYDLNNSDLKIGNEYNQFDALNKNQIKAENMNESYQLNNSTFVNIQNPVQLYQTLNNSPFDNEITNSYQYQIQNQDRLNSLSMNGQTSMLGQVSAIQNISTQDNSIPPKQQIVNEMQIDSVREIQPQAPRGNYTQSNQEQAKFDIKDNEKEQKNSLGKFIVQKKHDNNIQSTVISPNNKSNRLGTNPFDLMSPQGTNHQILSVKGTHASYNLMIPQNNSAFNLISPQNNLSAKSPFNFSSPKQSAKLPFTKRSNKSKYVATQTNINSATMKQTQAFVNQKTKKDHKNLQDAIDQSSNASKNSQTTSDSKSISSLILSKKRLGIMNIVDIFGIISFIVIIVVIVQQYFQMVYQFDDFQSDMGVVGWPTQYMNSLSFMVKNVNLIKLLAGDLYIKSGNATIASMKQEAQSQVTYAIDSVRNLTNQMEQASDQRQIFNRIRETPLTFYFGSNYNFSIPLNTQSSSTYFQLKSVDMGLFFSLLMLIVYMFRFGNSLGLGSGQFITLSNKVPIEDALNQISVVSLEEMNTTLEEIQLNLTNVLIILLVVIFCCIFISIPIFILIQYKKQQLLQLFGTFNSSIISKEITQICNVFFNMNYGSIHNSAMKFVQKSQAAQESEKRQNLSSTSSIEKFNLKILILSVFIFCITLPYPIINQVLSTNFIQESKKTLSILETLYQTEQMIIDNTSLNYFCIYLRLHSDPAPFKYSQNREKLKSNIDKAVSLKSQLEEKEKNLKSIKLSQCFSLYSQSQDLYDKFFYTIFEQDICQVMKEQTDLFVQGYIYNSNECLNIYNGIFTQGLTVALTKFISVYPDLYLLMEIQNLTEFKQKFNVYQRNLDFEQFYKFERYLAIVLKSLSQFVLNQNQAHEQDLKRSLMYLLIYQFIIITLIFYFGWVYFFKIMETELNDTKQYLSILHINFLMQNPYVQNYLYNNLS